MDFNKIYVIQSLKNDETPTGKNLYDNIIQYVNNKHSDITSFYYSASNKNELFQIFSQIENECKNGIKPLIHFEMHGLTDLSGLALINDYITWQELYDGLSKINTESGFNLFVTMAVCYGNYAMQLIKPNLPAPFNSILGSFGSLYVYALTISYEAFFTELIDSLDINSSISALIIANPEIQDEYKLITAEQTFKNVMETYYKTKFSHNAITQRFNESTQQSGIRKNKDRNQWNDFRNKFHATLVREKKQTLEEFKSIFFSFDKFPDNENIYCLNWQPE